MLPFHFNSDFSALGMRMYALAERLFPICRSITGNGLRETLRILQQEIPLTLHEVATGTLYLIGLCRENGIYEMHI